MLRNNFIIYKIVSYLLLFYKLINLTYLESQFVSTKTRLTSSSQT
jgi:hypothetical protein